MDFKHTEVFNFEGAIRGLRNPMNSWSRSDSSFSSAQPKLGKNDLDLAQRMIRAGSPNDKFMRQIFVSVDITGSLAWWKEMDQYKVGTVTDSCSTMHKIASEPITLDSFEQNGFTDVNLGDFLRVGMIWEHLISSLEELRLEYKETKDIKYWRELIRLLPESYLQKRTWTANYAVIRSICKQRAGHKLISWKDFEERAKKLPYAEELIFVD